MVGLLYFARLRESWKPFRNDRKPAASAPACGKGRLRIIWDNLGSTHATRPWWDCFAYPQIIPAATV
jgi:hypothetical protein